MARIVIGVTGASGIILAHRTIIALVDLGHFVEFVMTKDACLTAKEEMGEDFSSPAKFVSTFSNEQKKLIRMHHIQDFGSPIASGSFQFDAMAVIPCSMTSLAAIACGLSDNLLRRAADVTLKERRRLVLLPREMPFNDIHLENMLKLSRMGSVIIAPQPAWYAKQKTLDDIENFIVGKTLDALNIKADIYPRWNGIESSRILVNKL